MAHRKRFPGADPSNLWGNAREGSEVATEMQSRAKAPSIGAKRSTNEANPTSAGEAGVEGTEPRTAISLQEVERTFVDGRGQRVTALAGVTLRAARGKLLAVVGPSGCGKTTLLELICGLQAPDAGTLECEPAVLMPQRDLLLPWLDALDNAALALRVAHVPRAQARERAATLFAELGLQGFERSRPSELSGGMRQRVAFLRTLLAGKPVLCLDEPFGALDAITKETLQDELLEIVQAERCTTIFITHDIEEAVFLGDRVVVMSPGPGRIRHVQELPFGRPRDRALMATPAFGSIVQELRQMLHATPPAETA
jgi:ABC-type nitrate/sulfonate/bicarbonate transport system ATPase subunit